ncbi:GldG family protein [Clostridium boliviensis]|uniref:GldG family protein n=1 Tax=Clostridium boliviensis TaxID=318465 RepID=A0ABU4GN95_9CLOT|nr:GldG family protein [Clostridium boliviensis]MDW2798418.1 GldG family protein [Clostridium boliviensis]
MTRKLKKGGYTAILSVIVIAAVIILNMIVGRLPEKVRQWDMSSSQIYTLGETTKDLIKGLDKDVTIYVVGDPANIDKRITSFVNRYGDLSSHIKVETVDSVLHPEQLKKLNATDSTLLVSCETTNKTQSIPFADIIKIDESSYYYYGQTKETEFDGEGQLTGAISHVTSDVSKTIYATEGHGEAAFGNTVSDMLKKSNLTVNSINLLKDGKIPEDCELLLINDPASDLANDEKTMLTDYLDKGGHVLILAGYAEKERPNLTSVISAYGLNLENGMAADTKNFYQNNPYYIFPTIETGSDVTNGVDTRSAALVLQSAALTKTENVPDGITVTPFMQTSDGGMLVTEDAQKKGTYILGAVSEKKLDTGSARLTVFSTPTLIDEKLNTSFTNLTNLTLFMNAVTSNFEDVANVSIPSKSLDVTYNTVTHGGMWGILFIFVIPAAVLCCGLMVWFKRRRL